MQVNYIKHLESIHSKFIEDNRINPFHISLYMALFHQWNSAMFPEQLSIARSEVIRYSKIGSANTYTRCLRELNDWGYIHYKPSNNPYRGSLVNLYRFDNSCDNSTDNSTDTTPVIVVRPYINNINNNKQLNNTNIVSDNLKVVTQSKLKKEIFISPSFDAVVMFFKEKNKTDLEAQKFFNHFESNGWLVGGKAKMKNWHAAARNWILNSEKFQSGMQQKKPGDIAVNQDKKYDIPL
jgi:hypothetical protein